MTDGPTAVLLDIEGTIGSLEFVRDQLFPYARTRLAQFVREHANEPAVASQLAAVAAEIGADKADVEAQIAALERWSLEDRKVTPLKALQGQIWARGYAAGELRAHLYPDAVRAIRRWRADGRHVSIYSSGSVEAQKLYLRHSDHGDLTSCINQYFDTTTGPKQSDASYRSITAATGIPAAEWVFFSDAAPELVAAKNAGFQAEQVRRERPARNFEPFILSFEEAGF